MIVSDCLFCKIVAGDIPSSKVFENDKVFVFLDISPVTKGHMLIVPKQHFENIFDITEDVVREVGAISKKMSDAAVKGLKADGVNLLQSNGSVAQQEVMHFHMHVMPRYAGDGVNAWPTRGDYKKEELGPIASALKSGF